MKRFRFNAFRAVVFALALACGLSATAHALDKGDKAVDFTLPGRQGTVKLSDKAGSVIYLDFWASWCGPCKKSFPELEAIHAACREQGLVVLGVCVDRKAADMEAFLKAQKVSFPIVHDAAQKFVRAAGISAMPTSLIVDRKGVLRGVHVGFRGAETVAALRTEIRSLLEEKP